MKQSLQGIITPLLVICALCLFGIICAGIIDGLFEFADERPRGQIEDPSEWPYNLAYDIPQMQKDATLPEEIEVFRLYDRSYEDAAIRFPVEGTNLEKLRSNWRLSEVDDSKLISRFHNNMPEEWNVPPKKETSTYYASNNWIVGGEGDFYIARVDSAESTIYVDYYFNF